MKRRLHLLAAVVIAILTIAAISGDRLKRDIQWLSDPAREGRRAGAQGAMDSANYVAATFKEAGFEVQMQEFSGNRRNVVARTGQSDNYILMGAHYDGQGEGMPSASDNASGVALVLELARELKAQKPPLPLSIVAIAFDDEEQGLNGSRFYAENPIYPLAKAHSAVIFDTLGRSFIDMPDWTLFVLGTEYSKELASVIKKRNRPDLLVVGTDLIGPRSDFAAFAVKRVPYLFFTNGTHIDYHGAGDTPDKIDYAHLVQDSKLILQVINDIARLPARPVYVDEPIYPATESAAIISHLARVEKNRDLPEAYRLMFADLKERLKTPDSREPLQVATSALLAVATPRLSSFMLSFIVGPYYEREAKREIAAATYEEALKFASNASSRRLLEDKVKSLRN